MTKLADLIQAAQQAEKEIKDFVIEQINSVVGTCDEHKRIMADDIIKVNTLETMLIIFEMWADDGSHSGVKYFKLEPEMRKVARKIKKVLATHCKKSTPYPFM